MPHWFVEIELRVAVSLTVHVNDWLHHCCIAENRSYEEETKQKNALQKNFSQHFQVRAQRELHEFWPTKPTQRQDAQQCSHSKIAAGKSILNIIRLKHNHTLTHYKEISLKTIKEYHHSVHVFVGKLFIFWVIKLKSEICSLSSVLSAIYNSTVFYTERRELFSKQNVTNWQTEVIFLLVNLAYSTHTYV